MISKIKDASAQIIQQYQKIDSAKNEGDKPVGAEKTIAAERVNLSSKAKDIQKIKQVLDQTPEVNDEKIQELKSKIEGGSYEIYPDEIADKMLKESLIDIII